MAAPEEMTNTYTTGTGQKLTNVHKKNQGCIDFGCVVHNPTDHHMKSWKTHFRQDRYLMERICPHGVGHPDPDHLSFVARVRGEDAARAESVHGCDGCCQH